MAPRRLATGVPAYAGGAMADIILRYPVVTESDKFCRYHRQGPVPPEHIDPRELDCWKCQRVFFDFELDSDGLCKECCEEFGG